MSADLVSIYGPRMTIEDLAKEFMVTKGTIYNKIYKGTFEISVYKIGGRVFADTTDVEQYFDDIKFLATKV